MERWAVLEIQPVLEILYFVAEAAVLEIQPVLGILYFAAEGGCATNSACAKNPILCCGGGCDSKFSQC